jgi:Lipase (class 3)
MNRTSNIGKQRKSEKKIHLWNWKKKIEKLQVVGKMNLVCGQSRFVAMQMFLVIAFVSFCGVHALPFNPTVAQSRIEYATASYCLGPLGHGVASPNVWNCAVCKLQPGLQNISVFSAPKTDGWGYVGRDEARRQIIVAHQGTDPLNVREALDDLNFVKTDYKEGGCDKCKVHRGFYETWKNVRSQVFNAVELLALEYPGYNVSVTGHSLGAALATLSSSDLLINMPSVTLNDVYVFGLPRVGNKEFAQFYNDKAAASSIATYHVVNWRDPVPHLPPKSFGFHHVAIEVFYSKGFESYVICDGTGEDRTCSDRFDLPDDILDHLFYYISITSYYLKCKL